ncbi:MAG TPA: hypothetical protein VGT98_02495 [Candidatus Elarobacter sp.]|nr:hypothetical protein [Candidatus Elarobacter sp.]
MSLFLTIASPIVVHAQAKPPQSATTTEPPAVLVIGREEVKPGKAAAHAQWEAGWPSAFAKVNYPTHYIAMTSMAGPNEAWYLTGYPSWDAMEKDNMRIDADSALSAEMRRLSTGDGDFLSNISSMVAVNIPALNYGGPVDIGKMHYFEVLTFRMRPGHAADFAKIATMYKNAYTKAKIDRPWAAYTVASGAPGGTFLILLPMRSLGIMDSNMKNDAAVREALGADMAAADKMVADGVISSTSQIMQFSPKMSYVSAAMKASDPSFCK